MLKVKRTITIEGKSFIIWLGLINKNGKFTVYLLTDSPGNHLNHAEKILSGIDSKNNAIQEGIFAVKKIYRDILKEHKED